ncbi:hypothetical protein TREMEDRAFT_34308, partial [Tremella mesenterica DSM 1558]|uniref:uncharacterized protein n=1 Tax=Tremella mesenterica (strain ATCC 24925 / CBS 8224 / DSM 1558 / NBRC 9311 / NRRL Y-6157 / RJB 2259-6 / UBC 559-6) TaxID=578456 RepID=UPI0003F49140
TTLSVTIVSALSQSDQHTTFLRLLQRAKCIPMLAHMANATIFAPTNKAWDEWAKAHRPDTSDTRAFGWLGHEGLDEWNKDETAISENHNILSRFWDIRGEVAMDNHNWALRQHLLYHLLNYTLPPSHLLANESTSHNITTETTLLYPMLSQPPLPPVPEPGPPWLPRGGEGLLAGHGQRLRVAKAKSEAGGQRGRVGVDWNGSGGVEVWDGSGWKEDNNTEVEDRSDRPHEGIRWVQNGVVIGVEGVLDMPASIDEIIRTRPELSYLSRLLPPDLPAPLPDSLHNTPHLTVFAPSNDAFSSTLDNLEKGYLESDFGAEGVGRVVAGGVILEVKNGVGWADTWDEKPRQVQAISGQNISIASASNGSLIVNGSTTSTTDAVDIFASNAGVVHIVPTLLLPDNFTLLNSAEKMLVSLNATRFVGLLRSANLSSTYVGEPGKEGNDQAWTFLAPTDEVLESLDKWGSIAQLTRLQSASWTPKITACDPLHDASPLAQLLQYHILPGRLLPKDVEDGMLLATELRTTALSGGRQRLRVDVSETLGEIGGKWKEVEGEIRFGGATVVGKPVKSGKSIIYLISKLLAPPDDVLQTAVSNLQLSTFVAAVYAADLDKYVKHTPAATLFIPRNRAFGALGLAMKYLLLSEGKDELRKLVKYHMIQQIIYTPDLELGRQVYPTLEGGEIILRRTSKSSSETPEHDDNENNRIYNMTLYLQSPTKWQDHDSGKDLPANGELRPARIVGIDALTQTGVIHTIDEVVMPADIDINIGKLVRGSKQTTMAELLVKSGMGWILQGREPTDKEVVSAGLEGIVSPAPLEDSPDDESAEKYSLAMPAYTLLCPTDKAFSRLNMTYYLQNPDQLRKLLKLHIIPTQRQTMLGRADRPKSVEGQPRDGRPLALDDDAVYATLLTRESKYGEVAFRATGDNSFLVGIRNARSSNGVSGEAARIGQSGRASVRWRKQYGKEINVRAEFIREKNDDEEEDGQERDRLWEGGMTLGGGVVMLDGVLLPYEPSWFSRWGWLVVTLSGIGVLLIITATSVGWWWFTRGKHEYAPLEGEEEE